MPSLTVLSPTTWHIRWMRMRKNSLKADNTERAATTPPCFFADALAMTCICQRKYHSSTPLFSRQETRWLAYQWSLLPTQSKNNARTLLVTFYISIFASENELAMEMLLAPVFFYLLWPSFFRFSCQFPFWCYGCCTYFNVIFKIYPEFFLHIYGLLWRQNKAFWSIFQ